MMNKPLRFGILGAGNIATKMAATLDFLRNELIPYAISARDISRAEALRSKFNFEKAYGSYDEMLRDPNVDVVYISTTNPMHYEHAKASLLAGKHIICEKPFTVTTEQAIEIFSVAKSKNLFALEAVWTRFQPYVKQIKEIIDSGEIGTPRFIQATFALQISHKERMIEPTGGGALLDLGIYPIHFASLFLGYEYTRLTSHSIKAPSGVDDQSTITLEYANGAIADLSTSMSAAYGTSARIAGTRGSIDFPMLIHGQSFTVKSPDTPAIGRIVQCPFDFSGYEYEIRAAIKAINGGKCQCDECTWDDTLAVTRLMEKLRNSWKQS